MTRAEEYRVAAGLPKDGPAPVPCYGACHGVAGWKDENGLHCCLCGGSAKVGIKADQRREELDGWEHARDKQVKAAERAQRKRDAQPRIYRKD